MLVLVTLGWYGVAMWNLVFQEVALQLWDQRALLIPRPRVEGCVSIARAYAAWYWSSLSDGVRNTELAGCLFNNAAGRQRGGTFGLRLVLCWSCVLLQQWHRGRVAHTRWPNNGWLWMIVTGKSHHLCQQWICEVNDKQAAWLGPWNVPPCYGSSLEIDGASFCPQVRVRGGLEASSMCTALLSWQSLASTRVGATETSP